MTDPDDFSGDEVYLAQSFRSDPALSEHTRNEFGLHADPLPGNGHEPPSRVMGSPLPMGTGLAAAQETQAHRASAPPGRGLTTTSAEDSSNAQRAMAILKQALPFVQKLLPLIDGSFGAAISNLIAPRQQQPSGPPPSVDLSPVTNQISDLQMQHNELRSTVQEQTTGLKRVEDQLEMVREATDRNTLEQQELIEDLKNMGNKVNMFAVTLSALLLLSLVLNVILYLHIKRVLP